MDSNKALSGMLKNLMTIMETSDLSDEDKLTYEKESKSFDKFMDNSDKEELNEFREKINLIKGKGVKNE